MTDAISRASYLASVGVTLPKCYAAWSRMSPEEWAEEVYRLPNGKRFRWSYAPFARGMFNAIWDKRAREVVYQCFSRGFKTTCTLLAAGYSIDQAPRRILWMWQTVGHAEKFSKEGLGGELFDTTPVLQYLSSGNRRLSSNTITFKRFPGGSMNLFGANAPGELRRAKGNLLIADEVDAYEQTLTDEGEILSIFDKRGSEYPDTIRIKASYPSLTGHSRIQSLLNESDYQEWFVTCALCGGEPFIMHRSQLRYEDGKPITARLECPRCAGYLTDAQRYAMAHGQGFDNWRPRNAFSGRHGFHANSLLWPHEVDEAKFPGGYLGMLAGEEMAVKTAPDPRRALRVLVNTGDAEPFDPTLETEKPPDWKAIFDGREDYGLTIPSAATVLTLGGDVQKDRVELGWRAWSEHEESWGMDHIVCVGYVRDREVWCDVARELARSWKHASGATMQLSMGLIDGSGYSEDVYRFFQYLRAFIDPLHPFHRQARAFFAGIPEKTITWLAGRVRASRGIGKHGHPTIDRNFAGVAKNLKGHHIGTWEAKDRIYGRLRMTNPGSPRIHFNKQFSEAFCKQLCVEVVTIEYEGGEEIRKFENLKDERNEALDIEVGNLASFRLRNWSFDTLRKELENQVLEPKEEATAAVAVAGGSSWATGGQSW